MDMSQDITSKVATLCVFSLLLNACAFVPDNWAFQEETIKTEALSNVKVVALLDVPQPSNIWLGEPDSATAGFINPLISLAVSTHEGDTITNSAYISETTRNELKKWLEQAGKEVILLDAKREKKSKMLESYEQFSEIDADAILEVAPVKVGFEFELGKVAFRESKREVSPVFFYKYRLVSAKNGEVLVQSNVYYSAFDYSEIPWEYSANRFIVGNKIRGPSWHVFENIDAVKKNQEEAVNRLTYGIERATKMISVMVTN